MANLQKPVLVIDDEADIRDLMEMTLMKMGLSVDTADGVNNAKDKLDEKDYALVLTDMRMPDGSGLEVVQYINELMLDVPVAVITAFGNADQAVEALNAGAFDYIQKPITLSQLRTLVKSAIKVNDVEKTEPAPASSQTSSSQPVSAKPFVAATKPAPVAELKKTYSPPMPAGHTPSYISPSVRKGLSGGIDAPMQVPAGLRSIRERLSSGDTQARQTQESVLAEVGGDADMPRLLGMSPQMVEVRHLIRRLAGSNVPVYIAGESGSGKEQAARSIHELSPRAGSPFIAVNCGAIPENLMESEFFGYKKGSFTGADKDHMGFFQHANGGTLFLDEVADLPLAMQVQLLRAIQEKAVRRLGDAQEVKVDVRIVCATHKDLAALVESGAFRQDLYYRLNVVSVTMPPLREMREDLGALIIRLLQKYQNGAMSYRLTPNAQAALLQYSYPGNFRELENILERAVALTIGNLIQVDDLQISALPIQAADMPITPVSLEQAGDMQAAETENNGLGLLPFIAGQTSLQEYLDKAEQQIIEQVLQKTRYNRTQAAKMLGISFRSMRYRMERLGLD